jgi:hypothetical protein
MMQEDDASATEFANATENDLQSEFAEIKVEVMA